uniref:Ribosomal protein L16 n=1 Tax=Cyanoptyche gloeocystis TaxID=77922 RepID=A0A096Y6W9_9EUKA|nr:ribosomal protein L16 [Cyanoptyche gloeocystis]AIM52073.1 ribosomal protein L16 [Cyanoptyche gloeocystis]
MKKNPKKLKFKKLQKGCIKNIQKNLKGIFFTNGVTLLKSIESGIVTSRQIESIRIYISKRIKKIGKLCINIFPDYPTTKKPAETRMGKGKGAFDKWVSKVPKGKTIIQISNYPLPSSKKLLKKASTKLSIKTNVIDFLGG